MSKLPDYDFIIWINYNEFGKKVEKDILSIVVFEPYDRNEYAGVLDMHWGFESWDDAVSFSEALKKFVENPNVIFMKASNVKYPDISIIYKDED